jgi:hypothetical protein
LGGGGKMAGDHSFQFVRIGAGWQRARPLSHSGSGCSTV